MAARAGRYRYLIIVIVFLGLGTAWADTAPSPRLRNLVAHLPPLGQFVSLSDLGITIGSQEKPPRGIPGGYNFRIPSDLDRDTLERPPLHLNQPLRVRSSDVQYLFMSDQPEEMRDDRRREDGTRGAVGIYARETIPAQAHVRVLLDHTDGTSRPLRLGLVFLPESDGTAALTNRGQAQFKDSVKAGMNSFVEVRAPSLEPRVELHKGQPWALFDMQLSAGNTAVAQMDFAATVPGTLACVAVEAGAPLPSNLDTLPVLHSIRWSEEEERLHKFLDEKTMPRRWKRILGSFQHSRGGFHHPDRRARVVYNVNSWGHALQVYSLFESVPGNDGAAPTDNRGKYGAFTGLDIHLAGLPPHCSEMALLVVNPNGKYGGRHHVTDGVRLGTEWYFLPSTQLLDQKQACLLWRGTLHAGDCLRLWTEPMANLPVSLWYVLVPIPEGEAVTGGK